MSDNTLKRRGAAALLAGVLLLIACSGPQAAPTPTAVSVVPTTGPAQAQSGASIDAQPNPVPAGSGLGTTTIAWKTGDGSQGQVYVSEDGGAENLFDAGTDDSKDAPWIRTGSTYEFRLYAGADHTTRLGSVRVTRAS